MISRASSSTLHVFELCPLQAKLKFVDKIKEPEQENSPLVRGTQIHTIIENYVRGEGSDEPPAEAGDFGELFQGLRILYSDHPDMVLMEEAWKFDGAWEPLPETQWEGVQFIAKLDYFVLNPDDPCDGSVVDVKTGKKEYNIVKHLDQMMAYAISVFMRFPAIERVNGLFTYVDIGEELSKTITREQAMQHLVKLNQRIQRLMAEELFYPKPSKSTCRFCPYKTGPLGRNGVEGTGDCDLNPV